MLLAALLSAGGTVSRADEPLALAGLYAAGRRAEAVGGLHAWDEGDLKRELAAVRANLGSLGGAVPEARLRAEVMLHTDREFLERLQPPAAEKLRECAINEHAAYARALASLLVTHSARSRDFVRRWLMAMALQSHWDMCLDDVMEWTHEGLRWFPDDPELLLIRAAAGEVSATLASAPPPLFSNPGNRRAGLDQRARWRQALTEAQRDLETALELAPDLHEARLRLGRVLWRLQKPGRARVALRDVVSRAQEPSLVYLGHLFLGRVVEGEGDLAAAAVHYRAALAVDPAAQSAAVALAQVLLRTGEDRDGREVLTRALQHAPRDPPRDAFMSYHLGRSHDAEVLFDALRAETLE